MSEPCSDTAGKRGSRWRRRRGGWKWMGRQRRGSRVRGHCGLALKSWECEERLGVGDRLRFSATNTPFDRVTVIRNIGFKLGGCAVGKESWKIGWVVNVSVSRFDLGLEAEEVTDSLTQFVAFGARGRGGVRSGRMAVGLIEVHWTFLLLCAGIRRRLPLIWKSWGLSVMFQKWGPFPSSSGKLTGIYTADRCPPPL